MQDLLQQDFMVDDSEAVVGNETLELLKFVQHHGVSLTGQQLRGIAMLREYGLDDVANLVLNGRSQVTPFKRFMELIGKLTLADRIKGNAKLSSILKANANPANGLSAKDFMSIKDYK